MRCTLTLFRIMMSNDFTLPFVLHFTFYLDATNPITPIMSSSGNATESSPPATITIRINGRNTTVNNNFDIPQAALTPKINNFPNIQIIHIVNSNDNIFFSFCRLSLRLFISFCSRVLSTWILIYFSLRVCRWIRDFSLFFLLPLSAVISLLYPSRSPHFACSCCFGMILL